MLELDFYLPGCCNLISRAVGTADYCHEVLQCQLWAVVSVAVQRQQVAAEATPLMNATPYLHIMILR